MKKIVQLGILLAAMVVTWFVSTAGRDHERHEIKMLRDQVHSLNLAVEILEARMDNIER